MKKLYFLFTIILCAAMPIMAQHTDDNRNKAVFQSTDGNNEVNTDDIQLIRFEGGKVTPYFFPSAIRYPASNC